MIPDQMHSLLDRSMLAAQDHDFEEFSIQAEATKKFAVRIALSKFTRENILTEEHAIEMAGSFEGKSREESFPFSLGMDIEGYVQQLKQRLLQQSANKEYIPAPKHQAASFQWRLKTHSFEQDYGPNVLYPILQKHIARISRQGFRVTGFIEVAELHKKKMIKDSAIFETFDYGISVTLTVDDQQGATGAARKSFASIQPAAFDQEISTLIDDATAMCARNKDNQAIEPGDYTVILSPAAVADLLNYTLAYKMFDRREIDEHRSYLKPETLTTVRFPPGLKLEITPSLMIDGQQYSEPAFNCRNVFCPPLSLIKNGGLNDFFYSPFWAKKHNHQESFEAMKRPPLSLSAEASNDIELCDDLHDLIRNTKKGIYIASLWYIRMVNPNDGILTGMTRDGIFKIENGQITRPLVHMRWHQNPIRLLQNITGVGREKDLHGLSRFAGQGRSPLCYVPAVRADNFHFSSVTKF